VSYILEKEISEIKEEVVEVKAISSSNDLKNKFGYQVKPLLREYIKDGVLNENARKKVQELKFESIN
jgi:hypothetical protein